MQFSFKHLLWGQNGFTLHSSVHSSKCCNTPNPNRLRNLFNLWKLPLVIIWYHTIPHFSIASSWQRINWGNIKRKSLDLADWMCSKAYKWLTLLQRTSRCLLRTWRITFSSTDRSSMLSYTRAQRWHFWYSSSNWHSLVNFLHIYDSVLQMVLSRILKELAERCKRFVLGAMINQLKVALRKKSWSFESNQTVEWVKKAMCFSHESCSYILNSLLNHRAIDIVTQGGSYKE